MPPPDEYILQKWHIAHVWCAELNPPHHKLCICICPERHWYYFINSDRPYSRKAREVVLEVTSFELHCIQHDSFIDTTVLQKLPPEAVTAAVATENGRRGAVPPFLRRRIVETVDGHKVLPPDELEAVMND
jgi:hypothetical protein